MALASELPDFALVPAGHCYVLDASAVMDDPGIDEYLSKYKHLKFKLPAVFVLTTTLLNEVDEIKYKGRDTRAKHNQFYNLLRKYSGSTRLSEGPGIGENARVVFLKTSLDQLNIAEFEWLSPNYGDRHILSLAWALKESGRKVSVVSRDSMMAVLAKEHGFSHIFLEREETEDEPSVRYSQKDEGETVPVKPSTSIPTIEEAV